MNDITEINFAFIDGQNLYRGVRDQGWELDYLRFRNYLKDKYKVRKAYIFIGYIQKFQKLYHELEKEGYDLIYKKVAKVNTGINKSQVTIKGNVDAELVLHTMIEYPNFSKAVIVSGDGDFYCLIEFLESKNKLKKIIVPNEKYSSNLREYSGFIVNIDLFRGKVGK